MTILLQRLWVTQEEYQPFPASAAAWKNIIASGTEVQMKLWLPEL
jgi:hypothetical protein